jgi:hypothetical protein
MKWTYFLCSGIAKDKKILWFENKIENFLKDFPCGFPAISSIFQTFKEYLKSLKDFPHEVIVLSYCLYLGKNDLRQVENYSWWDVPPPPESGIQLNFSHWVSIGFNYIRPTVYNACRLFRHQGPDLITNLFWTESNAPYGRRVTLMSNGVMPQSCSGAKFLGVAWNQCL